MEPISDTLFIAGTEFCEFSRHKLGAIVRHYISSGIPYRLRKISTVLLAVVEAMESSNTSK